MKHRPNSSLPFLLGAFLLSSSRIQARDLSFQERVQAQEAIERVYYSHQIGAKRPFEQAVPRSLLEEKVRTYLKQSAALESIWRTPVTGEALQHEIDRIARSTRAPDRLEEIREALGHDEFVIQECFARAALVNRLARNFLRSDARFQGAARRRADALRGQLLHDVGSGHRQGAVFLPTEIRVELEREAEASRSQAPPRVRDMEDGVLRWRLPRPDFDRLRERAPKKAGDVGDVIETSETFEVEVLTEASQDSFRMAVYKVDKVSWDDWWTDARHHFDELAVGAVAQPARSLATRISAAQRIATATECVPDDTWDDTGLSDLPVPATHAYALWTGAEMLVWGGPNRGAARYDPLTDTWRRMSSKNAPPPGYQAPVWTGSEMIAWSDDGASKSGRYDPVSDTWRPMSVVGAPSNDQAVIWTGTTMIVWGGYPGISGGRYDPATDTWSPVSTVGAPGPRGQMYAVWSGKEMIIWGGYDGGSYLDTGGRYDPVTDTWTPTSRIGAPSPRDLPTTVWTGKEMIVWGGNDGRNLGTGGRYDPLTDTWEPMSATNAPSARIGHNATWTGSEMLIGGGRAGPYYDWVNTGARYDPATDSWTTISTMNAPAPRAHHVAVWTGQRLIVWGGDAPGGTAVYTGGRYDLATDTWTPTSTSNRPASSMGHTTVWTGSEMIVWGGGSFGDLLGAGAAFDPITVTWTAVSTLNAPAARSGHVAVWTGSRMVIWGGAAGDDNRSTGGRYDPIADAWSPTSRLGAPFWRSFRAGASAVWTGTNMIVWGGVDGGEQYANFGGRYDPETDVWLPVSLSGAPRSRAYHTAVWTGDAMLVWGGFVRPITPDTWLNDGYAYHPATDSWTRLADAGAPSPREQHSAVWTGQKMLIWGGDGPGPTYYLTDGAAYDPGQDTWEAIPSSGAPAQLHFHTAVWANGTMIVWGFGGFPSVGMGGRYDAIARTWRSVSQEGAPFLTNGYGSILSPIAHTAVWTGDEMIVWGGGQNLGAAYRIDVSPDADTDGFTACGGDCDDGDAAVHPGATESCDGRDDDCDEQVDEGFDVGTACTQDIDACHRLVGALSCAGDGTRSECVGPISLVDTTPPTVTAGAHPSTLWPPNHRMVDMTESVLASDLCSVPTVTLTSIRSLEPDDSAGEQDGETTGDIQGAEIGTADFAFQLRAERNGDGPGRAYEATYSAVDGSGNASSVNSIVFVPHDQSGTTEPILLSVDNSAGGTWLRWDTVPGALSYRAIRGQVANLRDASDFIDLGTVACLQPSSAATDTQAHADPAAPPPGEAFFYLVAYHDGVDSGFGSESAPKPEIVTGGSCP